MNKFIAFYKKNRIFQIIALLLLSAVIGLLWFVLLYGRYPLYFSHINWIYVTGGDTFQHQLGWEWFRQEPWHFPLGRIDAYGYPYGTYLAYTDSIPLFGIVFKLLSPLLSKNFQYLGIWELTSFIGQIFFGILILGEFTKSWAKKTLGASILVLSPILIFRAFGHDSLTAQWVLLAAIWFVILEYRGKLWRGAWLVLFAITTLIHLYLVAMLVPLWAVSLFFRYKRETIKWMLVVDLLSVAGVVLLLSYCIGFFSLKAGILGGFDYGSFSWNLNGFINPLTYSSILNKMPLGTPEQYEGFSYLGLGNLILFAVAFFLYFQKDFSSRQLKLIIPLGIISILYIMFSLSNKAFLNDLVVWDVHLPKFLNTLFSMFRSSGRFIWPVFYLIVLFAMIIVNRNLKYTTPLLVLALIIQLVDIQPLYTSLKFTGFSEYQSPLKSDFWRDAAKDNEHIIILPASEEALDIYQPVALYARKNDMTLNWGSFARADYQAIDNDGERIWAELLQNQSDPQTLYLLWNSEWVTTAKTILADQMVMCEVDGYNILISAENGLVNSTGDIAQYCSIP